MVKESSEDIWLKIKHTSEILDTDSPTKIARAILDGRGPPDLSFDQLRKRVDRLLKKRDESGQISPKRSPESGRPRTVNTPMNRGRVKKMKKKSVRQIETYTKSARSTPIDFSIALVICSFELFLPRCVPALGRNEM